MSRSKLMRRINLALALAPVCFLGTIIATTAAEARENYALIVAASDYPNLDPKYWLKGPKNDETLVRDYLLNASPVKFAPQNVVALGSGDGMQLATHQAILDNLAKIASEAKPGDFVYLHFSGHGSQEPALGDKTEADGRDEVFLSADTAMAPKDNPTFMPNVLTDDEVSGALKAIRKTGASVWVVFDSCHSATMNRGAPEDSMDRELTPEQLGIPDSAFTQPVPSDDADTSNERSVPLAADAYADDADNMGPLVAFFAAQTTETTQEHPFDVPQPDGSTAKIDYGVFTYTLFSTLAKNPGLTYRQLAQSILASYAAGNVLKPTPLFEGKLDQQVFGGEGSDEQQWPTVVGSNGQMTISAGQLHGLDVGSKLLVLPNPAASNDEAVGVVQVSAVTQLRSTLVPASDDTHPLIDAGAVPVGAYVRPAAIDYPFELKVARPDPASTDAAQIRAVNDALDSITADAGKQMKLQVVDAGASADVRLAVLSETQVAALSPKTGYQPQSADPTPELWLLPSTGEASLEPSHRAPTMPLPQALPVSAPAGDFTKGLENNLTTIFRATALSRLTQASTFKAKDFDLNFGLQEAGSDKVETMAAEDTPIVRPGDRLHVDLTNKSGKPMDLNVLYVDHNYGITLLCQAHLAPNDHLFQPMADINDSDQGSERIVAVLNESGKDLTDLSFLTQPGLPVATRGIEQGLVSMLTDLGNGQPTRAVPIMNTDTKTPRGAVVMVPVEALAATGKPAAADITPVDDREVEGSCAGE